MIQTVANVDFVKLDNFLLSRKFKWTGRNFALGFICIYKYEEAYNLKVDDVAIFNILIRLGYTFSLDGRKKEILVVFNG
jgi:hypothetical protein